MQACALGFSSCILASPSIDPSVLLRRVMPLLAHSASFAIFSNWMQPLADCMFKLQVVRTSGNTLTSRNILTIRGTYSTGVLARRESCAGHGASPTHSAVLQNPYTANALVESNKLSSLSAFRVDAPAGRQYVNTSSTLSGHLILKYSFLDGGSTSRWHGT